jgi:ubiquitin-like modifier-activating enzyme ATG7
MGNHCPFNICFRPYAPANATLNPSQSIPSDSSILGLVPHQIRGYLSHFAQSLIIGQAYNQCVACSPVVELKILIE